MIISAQRLQLKPHQDLVIAPFGDIHFNAPGHDRRKFTEQIQELADLAKSKQSVVLPLLMGDVLDTFSSSERAALQKPGLHESSRQRIESMILDDLNEFLDVIQPLNGLIPTVIGGNHTFRFQDAKLSSGLVGKTVDRVIAERLNAAFLGMCGALILEIHPDKGNTSIPFKIAMHHGYGNASTKSASIGQMIKFKERLPAMNLYIMGHNHIPIATVQPGIDVRKHSKTGHWRMVEMVQGFVRTGSFLKGYIEGEAVDGYTGSYIEEKFYVPTGLGIVRAHVSWKKNEQGKPCGFKLQVRE
jgi:predicted phosphodiesterase